jgi:hypothetical protein
MIVLCPRQRYAYRSESEALRASQALQHRFPGAHVCPTCGFWHAGHRYLLCPSRKRPYACKEEAQEAADETNKTPDGYGMNYPYSCASCGQWHIGRPHKGKSNEFCRRELKTLHSRRRWPAAHLTPSPSPQTSAACSRPSRAPGDHRQ